MTVVFVSNQYRSFSQRLNREVHAWTRLSHPNIAAFYGITRETNGLVGLVSPFFEKGNIVDYINSLDKASMDVLKLVGKRISVFA